MVDRIPGGALGSLQCALSVEMGFLNFPQLSLSRNVDGYVMWQAPPPETTTEDQGNAYGVSIDVQYSPACGDYSVSVGVGYTTGRTNQSLLS